ncbi:MAG: ketosynthase chain-length factor, partial [Thermoanaerobaculia bacterium]
LENADDARVEKVWGWFSGFAAGRDVTATISDWGTGADAVARVMRDAIADAGLTPGDIDAIFASANSGIRSDRLEGRAIRETFGPSVPPVVAVKASFGEYAGAGALQVAAALAAMRDQQLPATLGFVIAEPGLELPVNRELRATPMKHLLVSSLSAGGGIIAAVISRSRID